MLIVHVHVHVKPEHVDAFIAASTDNARASLREPGILRFDVIQEQGARERFVLVEVYRTDDAPARHKETPHYKTWRDAVEPMMAEPRRSTRYAAAFPIDDAGWRSS